MTNPEWLTRSLEPDITAQAPTASRAGHNALPCVFKEAEAAGATDFRTTRTALAGDSFAALTVPCHRKAGPQSLSFQDKVCDNYRSLCIDNGFPTTKRCCIQPLDPYNARRFLPKSYSRD